MPDDAGGAVGLTWRAGPGDTKDFRYQVFAAHQAGGPFIKVAEFPANTRYMKDRAAPWWSWRAAGDPIRLIREPYFGVMATVADLPHELGKIPTESSVRVLRAKLPDGTVVTVPRANVEIIET